MVFIDEKNTNEGEILRGVVANVLDCDIAESEFELQLRYYIHFLTNTIGKVWTLLPPPPDMG